LMADTFMVDVTAPVAPTLTVLQPSVSVLCAQNQSVVIAQRTAAAGIAKALWAVNDSALSDPTSIVPTQNNLSLPPSFCFTGNVNYLYAQDIDSAGNASSITKSTAILAITEDSEFYNPKGLESAVFDFKIVDRTQYVAWIGQSGLGAVSAQVAMRNLWKNTWTPIDTKFGSAGTKLALAVNETNDAFALANYGITGGAEVMVYIKSEGWNRVELPSFGWTREEFTTISLDYTVEGQLVIAYGAYGLDIETGDIANGHAVCIVNEDFGCKWVGKPRITTGRIDQIALTAKPSILEAVHSLSGEVEVYGLTEELIGNPVMAFIKTGIEGNPIEKVSISALKGNVHLMYFSSKELPIYQVINFSGKPSNPWNPGALQTLPEKLGIGWGDMSVDGHGRPIIALNGRAWGLDQGEWKSMRSSQFGWLSQSYNIRVQIAGDAVPYFAEGNSTSLLINLYRTGFELPLTAIKQP
jgi:hypothetical protein